MKVSIKTKAGTHKLTITVQGLNWEDVEQGAFYDGEVQVRDLLRLIGQELTLHLLRRKAVEAPTLEWKGTTYYRKAASPGQNGGASRQRLLLPKLNVKHERQRG